MPATISGAFEELKSNLEVTPPQVSMLSRRQEQVRRLLNNNLNIIDDFLIGSYRRHTMISPLSEADIDVFVVLDDEEWPNYQNDQESLLDDVRTALRSELTTPTVRRDGQAVRITWEEFKVDVVPAFEHDRGGYLIPDPQNNRWIPTDPRVHSNYVTRLNQDRAEMLVPLIKMVKCWNKHNGSCYRSFYLEMLVAETFEYQAIESYPDAFGEVIKQARDKIFGYVTDPAGYDGAIKEYDRGGYLTAQNLTNDTLRLINDAEWHEISGDIKESSETWREIFGSKFPLCN